MSLPRCSVDTTEKQYFSRPFTIKEIDSVKAHIRKNCLGAATGLDDVGYDRVLEIPSEALRDYFQKCVDNGAAPQKWIKAVLVAVKKPRKDGANTSSYRAIGIESCMLKTLSLLIERRLREWAEDSGRLPDSQSGFRKKHRTCNNAYVLLILIQKARSSGRTLWAVFLDLVNAFPSVNQSLLWVKLARWGASGPMLDWLRWLYEHLEYVVRHDGATAETFSALAGILIGDPASPILWILFLSDLELTVHPDDVRLDEVPVNHLEFADDAAIMTSSTVALAPKTKEFRTYCGRSFVEVGDPKTNGLAFGTLPQTLPLVSLTSAPVTFVPEVTYVGVTFCSTAYDVLKEHYVRKEKSARNMANSCLALEGFVGNAPPTILISLYKARVDPHLVAGCEVALDIRPASLAGLQAVQHTYLRRLLGLGPRSQLAPLFTETGIWPLSYRRAWMAVKFVAYLLRERPAHPYRALKEAYDLALHGHPSWWSDLRHVLRTLPVPVHIALTPFPTELLVKSALADLEAALARHLFDTVVRSDRLPLLKKRFEQLPMPPKLRDVCRPRAYLEVKNGEHREALIRLLTSEHKLAVEELRRVPAAEAVPQHRRICRFCRKRWAEEDEVHILIDCADDRLSVRRSGFLNYARESLYPDLDRIQRRRTSQELLDFFLTREKLLPAFAQFIFDVFEIVDQVPLLRIPSDAVLQTLDI